MTMYTPTAVANTLLVQYGGEDGITHMKLQKLVYCLHGWWLAYHESSLLTEQPQVWQYGPVFSSLYHVCKVFGNTPITDPVTPSPFMARAPVIPDTDSDAYQLCDWVWRRYGHLSAMTLSEMTHKEGTAWRNVAEAHNYRVPMGFALDDSSVREEFKRMKRAFEAPPI